MMIRTLQDLAEEKQKEQDATSLSSRTYKSQFRDDVYWLKNHTKKRKLYIYAEGYLFRVTRKDLIASFHEGRKLIAFITYESFMFKFV